MTRPSLRVLGAAATALAASALACDDGAKDPDLAGPNFDELDADQVMVQVEHYMTREGVRRAHLVADTVYLVEEGSTARLRHYTVDFFDGRGDRTSVLTADDGVYDMRTSDMRASGNVVVVDPSESQQLTTERLRYDAESGRLESDVAFTLVRGRDTVRGTGFVTDPGLDSLVTRQPAFVSPPENRRPPPSDGPGRGGGG